MNNREIDERIKNIDAQLAELEKEETKEKEVVERVKPDQTEEAVETLKEVVGEFNAIEDLKAFRDNDEQLYKNMLKYQMCCQEIDLILSYEMIKIVNNYER